MQDHRIKVFLFIIFSISGLTGLIYESIWSHYLKLVLGHAAYAQTLVLAFFMSMGGICEVLRKRALKLNQAKTRKPKGIKVQLRKFVKEHSFFS